MAPSGTPLSLPLRSTVQTAEQHIAAGITGLRLIQLPAFDVEQALKCSDLVCTS
jgi:hypothetical protein